MQPDVIKCPQCGAGIEEYDEQCDYCGSNFHWSRHEGPFVVPSFEDMELIESQDVESSPDRIYMLDKGLMTMSAFESIYSPEWGPVLHFGAQGKLRDL